MSISTQPSRVARDMSSSNLHPTSAQARREVENESRFHQMGEHGIGHGGEPDQGRARGHGLSSHARQAQNLGEEGARHAAQVADVCQGDGVITMLADDTAESVVFGDAGVIGNLRQGGIHISSSTISVALSEKMTVAHAAHGRRFVSAPVFGRPDAAAAGRLFVAVAGRPDAVDDCMPLLEAFGQRPFASATIRATQTWSSSAETF
jgi:3-hydroxyisobutyrate dehydrogenase-like beta-hydroxyacid dehydrogenase